MGPMARRQDFLDALRDAYQVIILSDTFYEFAKPLMQQLGHPTLCHSLEADGAGMLVNYHLHAQPEAGGGEALQGTQFQGGGRRRQLQRHRHAGRGPRRHPLPSAGKRHPQNFPSSR